jgi:uncharacterized protein (UPF0276 family)
MAADVEAVVAEAAVAAEVKRVRDRVGIGWRPELARGILSNLDRIDVIEVIAEDYSRGSAHARALKTLAAQVSLVVHGISLGMASTVPVNGKRLAQIARLLDRVQPESWSEHLAFVRGGDLEIGHLAAPPRTASTIEQTAANLDVAQAVVGSMPLMENIATLIDPPASDRDEPQWLADTCHAANAGMLLDLHNLYANATNFGASAMRFLARLPVNRVHAVHISGGRWMQNGSLTDRRILDDHLHDPPDPVYELLEELASRCPNPLTVILERDGSYPPMEHLLAQLDRARRAMESGRSRAEPRPLTPAIASIPQQEAGENR